MLPPDVRGHKRREWDWRKEAQKRGLGDPKGRFTAHVRNREKTLIAELI